MNTRIMFFLLLVCKGVFAIHRLDIPANYISHMRPLPKDEEKPLVLNCSIIPLFFVVFNAIYWPVILTEYFKDKSGRSLHVNETE